MMNRETLAQWGFEALQKVIAIDSSSDEKSATIPSTEGQRRLSRVLADHFAALGQVGHLSTVDGAPQSRALVPGRGDEPFAAGVERCAIDGPHVRPDGPVERERTPFPAMHAAIGDPGAQELPAVGNRHVVHRAGMGIDDLQKLRRLDVDHRQVPVGV